jgi:hypothetical protein
MLAVWLECLWAARRVTEPLIYPSLQVAVYKLREATGMDYADLAFRLGFPGVKRLEQLGKGFNAIVLYRLQRLAFEYSLPVMGEYFKSNELRAKHKANKLDYSNAFPEGFAKGIKRWEGDD